MSGDVRQFTLPLEVSQRGTTAIIVLPVCCSQGDVRREALAMIKRAIGLVSEDREERRTFDPVQVEIPLNESSSLIAEGAGIPPGRGRPGDRGDSNDEGCCFGPVCNVAAAGNTRPGFREAGMGVRGCETDNSS